MTTLSPKFLLCAVAAAAALSAGNSFAAPSLDVYGHIDLGLRSDNAASAIGTEVATGSYSGLGFKGSEDLGDNLQVFFQMEHRFDASTGAAVDSRTYFNEISVIGLKGHWGQVRVGRSDGPFALAADADAFGGDYVGGRGERRAGANEKFDNGIMYFSPAVAGWQLVLGTALHEGANIAGVRQKNPVAATVLYTAPGLTASIGYMDRANEDKVYGGSLTYDLGHVRTFLTVAHNDGKGHAVLSAGKRTTYDVGVGVPVNAVGSIRAKYNHDTHRDITTQNVGLGYWHALSKRTQLYVTGTLQKTDHERRTRAFDVGVVHRF